MIFNNENPTKVAININGHFSLRIFDHKGNLSCTSNDFLGSIFSIHPKTIERWKRGENPTLSILLDGCYLLQLSPFRSYNSPIEEKEVNQFIVNKVIPNFAEMNMINIFNQGEEVFDKTYGKSLATSKSPSDFYRRFKIRGKVIFEKSPNLFSIYPKIMLSKT